jgi:hypothetical protein
LNVALLDCALELGLDLAPIDVEVALTAVVAYVRFKAIHCRNDIPLLVDRPAALEATSERIPSRETVVADYFRELMLRRIEPISPRRAGLKFFCGSESYWDRLGHIRW